MYLLLIVTFSLYAQTNYTCNKLDSLSLKKADKFIGKDNLQNYYYTQNNQLFKQSKNKTYNYKNLALGEIHDIAIENPLQIVLLYKNFNTVVLLDNQLNEVQKIDFNTIDPFLTITSIGFGGQNKLWFFDSNSQKVGLYDLISSSVNAVGLLHEVLISCGLPNDAALIVLSIISNTCRLNSPLHLCNFFFSILKAISDNPAPR